MTLPPLKILYRNSDVVVIDKPPDIAINAWNTQNHPVTVATLLATIISEHVDPSCANSFRFVHRLDFSTSGVLCISLNKKSAASLTKAFHDRVIDKTYIALLLGHLKEEKTVDLAIGQDRRANHKMLPITDNSCMESTARNAKTQFVPIQYRRLGNSFVTKVRIKLFTGRRHQIRVHALHIGHPVLGDFTYTGDEENSRMYLHAKRLRFPHGNDTIEVESPLDFNLDFVLKEYS